MRLGRCRLFHRGYRHNLLYRHIAQAHKPNILQQLHRSQFGLHFESPPRLENKKKNEYFDRLIKRKKNIYDEPLFVAVVNFQVLMTIG